jgi:hypothetical protein
MLAFNELKDKYGKTSSWAIWNEQKMSDLSVIENSVDECHANFILIGLNTSKDIQDRQPWSNFHCGKHDRKLMKACNKGILRGSFMTDLFKDDNTVTGLELKTKIDEGKLNSKEHVYRFRQEMNDIGLTSESRFVIFGGLANMMYDKYFRGYFTNVVIKARHYSDYSMTDDKWVQEFLGKFGF